MQYLIKCGIPVIHVEAVRKFFDSFEDEGEDGGQRTLDVVSGCLGADGEGFLISCLVDGVRGSAPRTARTGRRRRRVTAA